jgi:hypothetical protein
LEDKGENSLKETDDEISSRGLNCFLCERETRKNPEFFGGGYDNIEVNVLTSIVESGVQRYLSYGLSYLILENRDVKSVLRPLTPS